MRYIKQGHFKDQSGNIVASGTVTVYEANSATLATIYSAVSGGSAVSGSAVTTDSVGFFSFYIDTLDYNADQRFKIKLEKTNFQAQTYDYIQIFPEFEYTYYASASATDQGVDSADNSLKDLLNEIGTSDQRTIVLKQGTYTVSTNLTVTANITVKMQAGAIFSVDNGITLTINGNIEASLYQIFSGSGTVSGLSEASPEWWGVDGTADNVQWQSAHDSLLQSGGTLWLSPGIDYSMDAGLEFSKPIILKSKGTYGYSANNGGFFASASFPDGDDMFHTADGVAPYIFEDFRIDMNNKGRHGMNFGAHGDIFVNRVGFNEIGVANTSAGIYLGLGDNPFVKITNNWFNSFTNGGTGIKSASGGFADGVQIIGNMFSLSGAGYYIDIDSFSGASHTLIMENVMGTGGKGIRVGLGSQTKILNNQIEQSVTLTNDSPQGALITLNGSASTLEVIGNNLNCHFKADTAIYVDAVDNLHIRGNVISDAVIYWLFATANAQDIYIYPNTFTNNDLVGYPNANGVGITAGATYHLIGAAKADPNISGYYESVYDPFLLESYTTASPPTAIAKGQLYYDSDSKAPAFYDGTVWSGMYTRTATVELTDANIKALAGTPITLVSAPGADYVTEFVSAVMIYDHGTTGYAEPSAPDDMVIEYATGTDITAAIDATGFITEVTDEVRLILPSWTATTDLYAERNQAIRLLNTGGDYTCANTDGAMTVKITYRLHKLGL